MIYPEDNITKHWWKIEETGKQGHKLTMRMDCGSPSTMASVKIKQIHTQGSIDQITQMVSEVDDELQPLHKLFQALKINTGPSINVNSEMIYLRDNMAKHWRQIEEISKSSHELTRMVDYKPPSTIVGVKNFR